MHCYWAIFRKIENNIFRFDTRIYLNPVESPAYNDICIGAIVGKNPGSAMPSCFSKNTLQKIDLQGDKLLPTVRSILSKSYQNSGKPIYDNYYIQVLNLMYICNKDLSQAVKEIRNYSDPVICDSEEKKFPFVWYVWGNDDKFLNEYKERFYNLVTCSHFYFNTKTKEVINGPPRLKDSARHTQGLSHKLVIPYISNII